MCVSEGAELKCFSFHMFRSLLVVGFGKTPFTGRFKSHVSVYM